MSGTGDDLGPWATEAELERYFADPGPDPEEARLAQAVRDAEWDGDGTPEQQAAHDAACVALRDHRARNAPYEPPSTSENVAGAVFGAVTITAEGGAS